MDYDFDALNIGTLASDTEDVADEPATAKKRSKQSLDDLGAMNPQFTFDLSGDAYQDLLAEQDAMRDVIKTGSKPVSNTSSTYSKEFTWNYVSNQFLWTILLPDEKLGWPPTPENESVIPAMKMKIVVRKVQVILKRTSPLLQMMIRKETSPIPTPLRQTATLLPLMRK